MMSDFQNTTLAKGTPGFDWPLLAFFALAYAIAWSVFLLLGQIAARSGLPDAVTLIDMAEAFRLGGVADQLAAPGWLIYLLTRVADFAFSIAGVIMIAVVAGRDGLRELGRRLIRWRVGLRWYLVALFLPMLLYGLAVIVAVVNSEEVLAGATLTPAILWSALFGAEAGIVVYFFTRGPLGEELGLRGFALVRLQSYTTPLKASLLIGLFWGLWHLPVLLGRDVVAIVAFLILAFALSILFTWLFNNTMGSLLPVMLLHATLNSFDDIYEAIFPALKAVDWETPYVLGLLLVGIALGIIMRHRPAQSPVTNL